MAPFLFLGGPMDGRRLSVPDGHYEYRVALPTGKLDFKLDFRPPDVAVPPEISLYSYYKRQFRDMTGRVHELYVGDDVVDPFARLLAGYTPEGEGR